MGDFKMEGMSQTARFIACPWCEAGRLSSEDASKARCHDCGYEIYGQLFRTLRDTTMLPEAVGLHACECGYPEMRLLPDGVYHCPACGDEVMPAGAPEVEWRTEDRSEAYWQGWLDGRYARIEDLRHSSRLARWERAEDRLEYHRGHRAGIRERRNTSRR
jgi:ribosomal protein L37AE/L43A